MMKKRLLGWIGLLIFAAVCAGNAVLTKTAQWGFLLDRPAGWSESYGEWSVTLQSGEDAWVDFNVYQNNYYYASAEKMVLREEKENGWKNLLSVSDRKVKLEVLQRLKCESGVMGVYKMKATEGSFYIGLVVYWKADRIYHLKMRIKAEAWQKMKPVAGRVAKSLRLVPEGSDNKDYQE